MEDIFDKIKIHVTPEYIEELGKACYNDDRNYPENFSNWYSNIEDFGVFRHSDIISNQIFTYEDVKLMQEVEHKEDVDWEKWLHMLMPTLDKMKSNTLYSIKNGCFSNKFDFKNSICTKMDLAEKLWDLDYVSHLFDTCGYTELVVREYIPSSLQKVPTIYNGMPLREELRVFYNMDTNQIEYVVDYWDYDYCEPNITNITDKIIFNWFHNKYGNRQVNHSDKLRDIEAKIRNDIQTLKFNKKLKGIWSIDFMYVDDVEDYKGIWLIDMARGFRSAYYDPDKLSGGKNNE